MEILAEDFECRRSRQQTRQGSQNNSDAHGECKRVHGYFNRKDGGFVTAIAEVPVFVYLAVRVGTRNGWVQTHLWVQVAGLGSLNSLPLPAQSDDLTSSKMT